MRGLILSLFYSDLCPPGKNTLNVFNNVREITLVRVVMDQRYVKHVPPGFVLPKLDPCPFEPTPDRPAAELVIRFMRDRPSHYIRPYGQDDTVGMAGGTFAYTSDSRFSALLPFYGAVSVHDRIERAQ